LWGIRPKEDHYYCRDSERCDNYEFCHYFIRVITVWQRRQPSGSRGQNLEEYHKACCVGAQQKEPTISAGVPISSEQSQPHQGQQQKDGDRPKHTENVVLLLSAVLRAITGCAVRSSYYGLRLKDRQRAKILGSVSVE
jgi:hypothetical protein